MADTQIAFTELLGRRVRMGPWEDQKISTYRKILDALAEHRWDNAAALEAYFIDEANVCFTLYRQWIGDLNGYLTDKGVSAAKIRDRNEQAVRVAKLPDGSPWEPRRHWDRFLSEMQQTTAATYREKPEEAQQLLDVAKETWRQCHDRDVDHTYALMSLVLEELGEPAVRDMYERVLLPLFVWRYEKFDIDKHPWDQALETLMLVACEAMRGHLVGPERTGDFELIELEDRYILRFDACGSGGRTLRGDWIERTPARMEAPYNWAVTQEQALLEPLHAGRLHLLRSLHRPDGGDADRPLRVPGAGDRSPHLPGHEPGPGRPPEMPVADVQGPDQGAGGVLHPRRTGQADGIRLAFDQRARAARHQRGAARRRLTSRRHPGERGAGLLPGAAFVRPAPRRPGARPPDGAGRCARPGATPQARRRSDSRARRPQVGRRLRR